MGSIENELIHGAQYNIRCVTTGGTKKRAFVRAPESENCMRILSQHDKDLISFDLETTGVHPQKDFIIEFTMQRFHYDPKLHRYVKKGYMDLFIKPPILVPEEATKVNHITNEFLEDKPKIEDVFPKIRAFIGPESNVVFVGYNIKKFDLLFLDRIYMSLAGRHAEICDERTIDVMLMAKECVFPEECPNRSMTLTNLCSVFNMSSDEFHKSSTDVEMTNKLLSKLIVMYLRDLAPFNRIQKELPSLAITWTQRQEMNYKTSGTNRIILVGVRGTREDGTQDNGHVYYDPMRKRWVDCGDNGMQFIGHYNMELLDDIFTKMVRGQ
jgi:DNA polymerase-3 subunit epsilon